MMKKLSMFLIVCILGMCGCKEAGVKLEDENLIKVDVTQPEQNLKMSDLFSNIDYDEYVGKIWDFKYITGISEPIHVWVQELKKQNIYMTFASLDNGKFVPYFNETLRVNLDFIDIVNTINNK